MEEDIKRISKLIEYIENADYVNASECFDNEDIQAIKNILKENENLKQAIKTNQDLYETKCNENKELEEEKEQYKNDYFNLYEQNKQYIHYLKIEELAKKIHNELDKNGITRAYQTIIDGYFNEMLEKEK